MALFVEIALSPSVEGYESPGGCQGSKGEHDIPKFGHLLSPRSRATFKKLRPRIRPDVTIASFLVKETSTS